ncbi:MAG: beta-propeller domain-containing protein [Clostridiales bacterium]|nr:beta-propeller domain-containing protein [Clostridiales bacterium]
MKNKNMVKLLAALLAVLMLASCMRAIPKDTEPKDPAAPAETQATTPETEAPAIPANPDPDAPDTEVPEGKPVSHKLSIVSPASYHEVYERLTSYGSNNRWGVRKSAEMADGMAVEEAAVEAPAAPMAADMAVNSFAVADEAESTTTWGSDDYSETNAQVQGIDEGDIVKTDGKYLYVLKNRTEIVILKAAGEATEVVSRFSVADGDNGYFGGIWIDDELVKNDQLDVYKNSWAEEIYVLGDTLAVITDRSEYSSGEVNGVWRYEDKNYTNADFYDISDRANPYYVTSEGQDGSYLTSRLKDGKLYLLTRRWVYRWNDYTEEDYGSYIPVLYNAEGMRVMPVDRIFWPETSEESDYTVLSRFSMDNRSMEDSASILGAGNTVYMSHDWLYLADTRYYEEAQAERTESVYTVTDYVYGNRTEILKISYADGFSVEATGTVDGDLLNQFSMDEWDGCLRVVTTEWNNAYTIYEDKEYGFTNYQYKDSKQTNGLYVFDSGMNLIGALDELAESERVYSVRFDGGVGYFVTFRQVDPLFTVDLRDPANPTIMSELKIPGFSNYLHPWGDGLLFGLGQNADEETGRTDGMKLSMFDVSDPFGVFERDKLSLDVSYSEGLYNHKAILAAPQKNLIGFPSSNGYLLYTYTPEEGFRLMNEVTINENAKNGWYYWWDGDSRGLYVGEDIYILTSQFAVVLDMNTGDLLARVAY